MKKNVVILIIVCLYSFTIQAQDKAITYGINYFGNNVLYPGLKASADYPLFQKEKTKRSGKIKTKIFRLSGDLGFFWHPTKYLGAFTSYGIDKVSINSRGQRIIYSVHPLGAFRSFLPETYEVSANGNVEKVFLPGNFYYAPSFSIGIAKKSKYKMFATSQLKTSITMLVGYNSSFLPLLNIEYGFRFQRKNKNNETY